VAEHRARKPIYKWVSFWLVLLLVLYTIGGFLVLPLVAEKQLPDLLKTHLGWDGGVEDVNFNPYLMTLEVTGFEAQDSDSRPVLRFNRLFTDLGFLRLFTGTIKLDDITLDKPFVRVDLLPDYGVNLARDWIKRHESEPEPDKESGSPPELFFDAIALNDGHVRFRDLSQETEEVFNIEPLNVTLKNLAVFGDVKDASKYELNAAIGEQQIQWDGTLNVLPFESQGTIKLNQVTYSTIWHFANAYAPYVLNDGQLSLTTDYRIATGDQLTLQTSNGQITVANLSARLVDSEEPFLTLDTLKGNDIAFDLQARQFSMASVTGDNLDARLKRDKDGTLNVIKPFQSNGDKKTSQNPSTDADSGGGDKFKWAVEQVTLSNSHLNWQDTTTGKPVNLDLNAINLEMGPLSQALGKPVSYQLSLGTDGQGDLAINGQTTLQPFTLQSALALNQVGLQPFEPYVSQSVNVALRSGVLTVDGDLDLDALDPTITGTFSGSGQIDDLEVTRPDNEEALLAWQTVTVKPIEFNFDPMRLEIGAIELQSPHSRFIRMTNGGTNFSNLTTSGDSGDSGEETSNEEGTTGPEAEKADSDDKPGFVFRIDSITMTDGRIDLTDRSVDPAFDDWLHELNGSVKGLTNVPPQQATIDLQGKIGELGELVFNGSVATVGGKEGTTKLKVQASNVALPEVSPYFANYLGYTIDNGKLKLDLDYSFTGTKISAKNQVIMDNLELGEKVESKQAVNVPVKLALSLLSNSNGVIDVTLPIEGDLQDPKFQIAPVIMRTFLDVLTKIATSPFSVLGSVIDLAGFSAEELGEVGFVPGKPELAEGEDKKLKVLADALSERTGVALKIRGSVAPDVDGAALRGEQLFEELGVSTTDPVNEIISALEEALVERQDEQALADLKAQAGMQGESRLQDPQWLAKLTDVLAEDQSLPPEALTSLASERGAVLQRRLTENFDIPGEQLYPLAPSTDGKIGMKNGKMRVIVPFSLDSR
jgi:hypothetical protein